MNKNISEIILTLSSLYEVLLRIGQSFDIDENAEAFLKTLMLHQNLSFAGYYTLVDPQTVSKVYSIPKTQIDQLKLQFEIQHLKKDSTKIIKNQDKGYTTIGALTEQEHSALAVYKGGSKSILLMSKKFDAFSRDDLTKYELVFNKFCLFMESLESHHQIKNEIKIKNEQALIIEKNSRQLKEQNEELRKYIVSNNELEKFAYRTSHDLKAPLRTLISFSEILNKNSESNLTEKQLEYLDFIVKGGIQMNDLIDGILEYSKINALEINKVQIDLMGLLDEIEFLLHKNIEKIHASIKRGDLPKTIIGDKTKIKQLFLNLLSNALKFYRKEVIPEIVITCKENKSEYQFEISDNGIGIRSQDISKIFDLFLKLNSNHLYSGSGIGLSTCKQIVLQHEGKIWVTSEFGKGSTFHFNISKF